MKSLKEKNYSAFQVIIMLTAAFLLMATLVYGAVTVPNTFSSGATISSSAVNANFTTLGNAMPVVKTITTGSNATITTSLASVYSITFTAPANGYVIVTGQPLYFRLSRTTAADNWVCMYVSSTSTGAGAGQCGGSASADSQYWPITVSNTFAVSANTSYTFYLTAYRDGSGLNTWTVSSPRMYAVFVPGSM